jgi:nucleoside 2-deoxyribosyltransferase
VKLIYIAGPYSAIKEREQNLRLAYDAAAAVCDLGLTDVFPVCPTRSTAGLDAHGTPEYFYAGTMELMRRCDAVLLFGDWQKSKGAVAEVAEANRIGKPVFQTAAAVGAWTMRERDRA